MLCLFNFMKVIDLILFSAVKNNLDYLRRRIKANARKKRFLDKMTDEQKAIKRAKDREYYHKKKTENKPRKITEFTEREKLNIREKWREASRKYRKKCRFKKI
ncbi:hypothetical protein O3G_MSEX002009 [Manduca sexta]|uniref:Uncharacterized protein n=1 Tax=Manduca sexta TaxID=7130 RepID=A0A922CDU0_MANSE|nr:hypothetical protein O3G_MSEX002009 [Manduca sexta]